MNISITDIGKAELFAIIFQHIRVFTENINIIFKSDQMYIQFMDSAHISIIEIVLPKDWFDQYELSGHQNLTLGVNSTILFRILNSREKTQAIHIQYDKSDSDKLHIKFLSENKNEFNKYFDVQLLDLDSELLEIPEMEHSAEFTLSASHFSNIIAQLKVFGDAMEILCTEDKIILYSQCQESGKMSVEINIDELTSFSINEGEQVKSSFGLTFLNNICLYNKIAKEIEIKITEHKPLKMVYVITGHVDAKMTFYLAPKFEED
jgi:proliferating cell nuclear antigen